MSWYIVKTALNAKDMYGEVAYIETEIEDLHDMDEDKAHTIIGEVHPKMKSGSYIKNISKMEDWNIESVNYPSEEDFMKDFGSIVGTASNAAYTLTFDRVSVKAARRIAN